MNAAVLDACVLYSATLRDLFMRLAVGFVFQPKWTSEIQDEWMRNVIKNRPDITSIQLERTRKLMEQSGNDWSVAGYEVLIPEIKLPDDKDRHVLAAAITGNIPTIVTFNLSDFPSAVLRPLGIRAIHPDEFLQELLNEFTEPFLAAVRSHRAALKSPPYNPDEYLEGLKLSGMLKTSAILNEFKFKI